MTVIHIITHISAKVAPAPLPPTEPIEPPSPEETPALKMLSEAEKNARELKLKQNCTQLSKCVVLGFIIEVAFC